MESGVGESDLTYQAFVHYMEVREETPEIRQVCASLQLNQNIFLQGCLFENPLGFIQDVDAVIEHTKSATNLLGDSSVLESCKDDAPIMISKVNNVTSILDGIQMSVRQIIELTGCHQINPVLRRITHGSACSETIDALAWLFGGMCGITLWGFIMLSLRAALFNSVIRAPRRKRHKEREKEFEEYKAYMAEFYSDADQWKLDIPQKKPSDILVTPMPTFETNDTSRSAHDDDAGSESSCLASPKSKSEESSGSSESSYESDYSDDSSLDQRSSMSFSGLSRIFYPRNKGDNHSFHAGISMLGFDSESHAGSVLELQTPRQQRAHSSLGLNVKCSSSPDAQNSVLQLQTPRQRRIHSSLGLYANFNSSPEASPMSHIASISTTTRGCHATPTAPAKPRHIFYRTKGATKDA
jgi:hypothetical protein